MSTGLKKAGILDISPEDLEEIGYIVRFVHLRAISSGFTIERLSENTNFLKTKKQINFLKTKKQIKELRKTEDFYVLSTGGKTICRIFDTDNNLIAEGYSICHPQADNFNRKMGRLKAFARAVQKMAKENSEDYVIILNTLNTYSLRPKINSPRRTFTLQKLLSVINDLQDELAQQDSTIEDCDCSVLLDNIIDRLHE